MTITDEMLMAYADGELDAEGVSQVEAALAEEPALARRLAAHRALKAQLQAHFESVTEEPLPKAWAATIAMARTHAAAPGKVPARYRFGRLSLSSWQLGVAWGAGMAAMLVLGLMVGTQFRRPGLLRAGPNGTYIAAGPLANALDNQLASAQDDAPIRMLVSFRRGSGDYCRGFATAAVSGIACHDGGAWTVVNRLPGAQPPSGNADAYRQAGSTEAELMAEAQTMATGEPLDAAGEAAARARGWK